MQTRLDMHYLALATDYDGTLARDGHVSREMLAKLDDFRRTGRKVILVTGRELPELRACFPDLGVCDAIVAENGALLYWPQEDREHVLGEAPTEAFITEMTRRDVKPFSVGRVIFATWRPHEAVVLETLRKLGLGHQIIFNKRAVMVLPAGISKASGLAHVLQQMKIDPACVVGIGDAENDHAFLDVCGVAVAVANGLPAVKEKCDLVMEGDHGHGVRELIDRILADDLQSLGLRRPRKEMAEREIQHFPSE